MKDEVIFLMKGKLRAEVLEKLAEPLTPVILSKLLNRPRPSISRVVKELEKKELVECLNPEKDRWRKYKMTEKGKHILGEYERLIRGKTS